MSRFVALYVFAALITAGADTTAFCGFYVGGAGADLYNDATQVVMMRSGTRTVLSMQNSYQGPPENFAMVVPVPVVLQEDDVKVLPHDLFAKVDRLAAPRLVEYWEEDPCAPAREFERMAMAATGAPPGAMKKSRSADLGVTIEAQFEVGEYDVVILSAKDSSGLDTWLRQEKYTIPEGAAPYFRPYIESGSKFFVAKVDTKKVTFKDGRAQLSPLRFHYDTEEFSLPIRLGLMNSKGTQDLIVHILAPGQRYELANMKNVTIPTNLEVKNETRERFGEFYASLFDATLEKNPGAVVTEYSWDSGSCDPCPTPPLQPQDLYTLGADVINATRREAPPVGRSRFGMGMVLTRLHARYGKDISEDLVFKAAPPIVGGREFLAGDGTQLEVGAKPGGINNFQGRYIIRHKWQGKIACENPIRNRWGGPWPGEEGNAGAKAATDLAFAPRGQATLASFAAADIPELGFKLGDAPPAANDAAPAEPTKSDKPASTATKKGCATTPGGGSGGIALLLLFAILGRRRLRART